MSLLSIILTVYIVGIFYVGLCIVREIHEGYLVEKSDYPYMIAVLILSWVIIIASTTYDCLSYGKIKTYPRFARPGRTKTQIKQWWNKVLSYLTSVLIWIAAYVLTVSIAYYTWDRDWETR